MVPALAKSWATLQEYEKATGKKIEKFNEAPILRTKVAAGELPSVEERLPEEPMVVEPTEEIGQYGGTFRGVHIGGTTGEAQLGCYVLEELINLDVETYSTAIPNIVKGWKWNEDATRLTFFLRKGMKWSDGYPLTADDFLFWYKDIILNDELTPIKPSWLKIGGELAVLKKIDDYTIELSFAAPYGYFIDRFANWPVRRTLVVPKHYLKQFHPNYTPMEEIKKVMKKEGFNTWMDLFGGKNDYINNPKRPSLYAWVVLNDASKPVQILERNPYYWKVDTEGNQLPYIDRMERTLVSDTETMLLKVLAGEVDMERIGLLGGTANYPILMQYREKGNYRLIPLVLAPFNTGSIYLNPNHKDPVIRKLFLNKKFRIALSVSLNREEINELIYKGVGTPSQVAPSVGEPYHGEDPSYKIYTQYDPELANKLLDEIGLKWDKNHEYRLRPDGKKLFLVINPRLGWPFEAVDMAELYKEYWSKVGIKTVVKPLDDKVLAPRREAGNFDIYVKCFIAGGAIQPPLNGYVFPRAGWMSGPLWGTWIATNGEAGEEPPADVKHLAEIEKEILATTSTEKRLALFTEAIKWHVDNLMPIGVLQVGGVGTPENIAVVNNRLRNVPDPVDGHIYCAQRGTWFIKQEK